jgi:hypothetical protein
MVVLIRGDVLERAGDRWLEFGSSRGHEILACQGKIAVEELFLHLPEEGLLCEIGKLGIDIIADVQQKNFIFKLVRATSFSVGKLRNRHLACLE